MAPTPVAHSPRGSHAHPIPHGALLILGLALFFALLFGIQTWVRARFFGQPPVVGDIIVEGLTRWLLYAAFTPAVGALVARYPLERGRLARRWSLHVATGLAFAALHSIGMALVYRAFHVYPREDSVGEAITRLLLVFFAVNFVVFCAISGVFHTIRYHREILNREQLAAGLRTRLATSRLDNLRGQLNPHFLFNTLNAVSTMALTGERAHVVETLSRLSDLLRVSLDRHLPQEIPLARELALVEGYLEIQRTRFGERLAFVLQVEPETLDGLWPSMMLQPLIENALQHGIEARPGPGQVTVTVQRREARMQVRVEDTGPGFSSASRAPSQDGIGLSNTRARLEELYGESQSLECGNLSNGGGFVQVTLPFHTAASEGAST